MKKLTIQEMFKGYGKIEIPTGINDDTLCDIAVFPNNTASDTLLFITDKIGIEKQSLDPSELKTTPFALVVSNKQEVSSYKCPTIRVESVRSALAYALSNSYGIDYDKTKIIGVTGTNGKTTTSTLIYEMLKKSGYPTGFIGTGKIISNDKVISDSIYSMTTPDPTVLYPAISKMIEDGCKYIVMEVSSHAIALGKIAPIKFEYAIFTNLDEDHLDFHGTKDEYFKAKLKLFKSAKNALFNLDDEYSRKAYGMTDCNKKTFGIINQGDAYVTEINTDCFAGSSFYYRQTNLIFKAKTQLPGAFNVYNSLAALKCVIDLGVKPCIAKKALESIDKVEGRMEIIQGKITVIIDYAHTPSAFYNCLKISNKNTNPGQNLIIVFGCGGDRDRNKRVFFGKYACEFASQIIITEDNCRNESFTSIATDIIKGIKDKEYKIIEDREKAIRYAINSATPGDTVAIIGKGHEKYKIVKDTYVPFDERKIVEDALDKMGYR